MIKVQLRIWLFLFTLCVLYGCRKSGVPDTADSLVPNDLRALLSSVPHSRVNLDEVATDTAYLVREIGGVDEKAEGSGDIFLGKPTSFVKLGDSIYICDRAENCIVVADNRGRLVRRIGRKGAGPLEFNYPAQIVSDGEHVLIYELGNARVQLLSRDFRYLFSTVANFPPTGPSIAIAGKYVVLRGTMGNTNCIRIYDREDLSAPVRSFLPFNRDFGNLKVALRDSVLAVAFVVLPAVMFFNLDGVPLHVVDLSGKALDDIIRKNNEAKLQRGSPARRESFIFLSMHWLQDGSLAFVSLNSIYILSPGAAGWLLTKKYVCVDQRRDRDEPSERRRWIIIDFNIEGKTIYVSDISIGVFQIR